MKYTYQLPWLLIDNMKDFSKYITGNEYPKKDVCVTGHFWNNAFVVSMNFREVLVCTAADGWVTCNDVLADSGIVVPDYIKEKLVYVPLHLFIELCSLKSNVSIKDVQQKLARQMAKIMKE